MIRIIFIELSILILAIFYLCKSFHKSWTCTREIPFTQADQRDIIRGGIAIGVVLAIELIKQI